MTNALDVARKATDLWRSVHGNKSLYLGCQRFDGYYWQWAYQGNDRGIVTYGTARAAALASRIETKDHNHPSIQPGWKLYWVWGSEWHVGTVIGRDNGRVVVTHTGSKGDNFMTLGNHVFVAHADSITKHFQFYGASRTNGVNPPQTGLSDYNAGKVVGAAQRVTNATSIRRLEPSSKSTHVGGGSSDLKKGVVGNFVGFIRGEHVNGSNIWLKGHSGHFFHISGYADHSLAGLPDLGTWGGAPAPAPAAAPAAKRAHVRIPVPWIVFTSEHAAYWNQPANRRGTVPAGDHLITGWGNDGKPVEIQAPGQAGVRSAGRYWIGGMHTAAPVVYI